MAAETKLSFADSQHLTTLLLDAICERSTVRQMHEVANQFLKEVGTTLSYQTIAKYIDSAKEIFNTPQDKTRSRMRTNAAKRLDTLYKRCIRNGDHSTALKIEKELTLIRGIYRDIAEEGQDQEQTINIVFKDAKKEDVE